MSDTPSNSELALLKALWRAGPMSAREAHEAAGEALGWSLSTTRTTLERMREKALVERKSVHGVSVYLAGEEKLGVVGRLVKDFAARVLEIDGPLPASAFTGSKLLTEDEAERLAQLLEEDDDAAPPAPPAKEEGGA